MENIISITSSIQTNFGLKSLYPTNKTLDVFMTEHSYKNIVLMVLDGLGKSVLDKLLKQNDFFLKNERDVLTSVVPATTVAATISLQTGVLPDKHGKVGWAQYFPETQEIVEVFTNMNFYTKKPSKLSKSPSSHSYQTIVQKIKTNGGCAYEVMPSFAENGCNTFTQWCDKIYHYCQKPEKKYVYAYWDALDTLLHEESVDSSRVQKLAQDMQAQIEGVLGGLKDTLIVITADHGHCSVSPIYLEDFPDLIQTLQFPISLEARCASFHVKAGCTDDFLKAFAKNIIGFKLVNKEDFISKYLSGTKNPDIFETIGDFVALATQEYALYWNRKVEAFPSEHAGITDKEMHVPLIISSTSGV